MSLLENMPHRCSIRRRIRTNDEIGGNLDTREVEQTSVECWEQQASASESKDYEKRGITVQKKIFFPEDPGVTERHEIAVTHRNGVAVSNPVWYSVLSQTIPDASAGFDILFKVMVGEHLGSIQ